mgnify:CR=1 FL=1
MKRIAIVEDEVYMREELAEMLRSADYEVHEITIFEDTAGQLLRLSPNLILLDINLPQASGFQICREIKQKSAIPVLVLTSRDQMRDELHALELGADEYLTKPCRKERLLARAANVLKRYEGAPICWKARISCWTARPIRFISIINLWCCRGIRESFWKPFSSTAPIP